MDEESTPRDYQVIEEILKSMGIENHEPRVVHQLFEFLYRYCVEVLQDSFAFANHADHRSITLDDVRLAIQSRVNFSFVNPPPREVLLELAHVKNSVRLPYIDDHYGVKLPPEHLCLTATNYQVNPTNGDT